MAAGKRPPPPPQKRATPCPPDPQAIRVARVPPRCYRAERATDAPPLRTTHPRMPESFRSRLQRIGFNLFPAYRATGARITYLADDFLEVRVRLPLNWRTRNYVGTLFGGSMFGAADPIYMVMLIRALGPAYVVWDRSASIRFRRPGRSALFLRFVLTPAELEEIRAAVDAQGSVDRTYSVDLADADGVVHATVQKVIHVRRRAPGA
jgi:acyl-coenzyme A thioesterase PaaI-like protein